MLLLGLLAKKGFFKHNSKFMSRELGTIVGLIGFNIASDLFASNYMWGVCKPIVRKYALIRE